jgi:hypothetical protein
MCQVVFSNFFRTWELRVEHPFGLPLTLFFWGLFLQLFILPFFLFFFSAWPFALGLYRIFQSLCILAPVIDSLLDPLPRSSTNPLGSYSTASISAHRACRVKPDSASMTLEISFTKWALITNDPPRLSIGIFLPVSTLWM